MKKEQNIKEILNVKDSSSGIKRRDFFKILGGGIFIFANPLGGLNLLASNQQPMQSLSKDFNAFLHIDESGMITGYTGKIDMGQSNRISLTQMLADELSVSTDQINMVMGDTELCPWDAGTNGSTSIRQYGVAMRNAAAEARMVLLQLGSEKMGIPLTQLEIRKGIVFDTKDNNNKLSYGALTKGKKIERHIDGKVILNAQTKYEYVGKSVERLDSVSKVTGEAKFTGDIRVPGMRFAKILRPPSHGAKLISVDSSEAEKTEGLEIVRDGDLIAVLHQNYEMAEKALLKIKAEYSYNEKDVNDQSIFDYMRNAEKVSRLVKSEGDVVKGAELSEIIIESEFYNSYVAHAPIEPHTALAIPEGDKMTVWASAQSPFPLRDEIAIKIGFSPEKVRVIVPLVGGAFGGKNANAQSVEAAQIAKLCGKPVMLMWTREEEFFYDAFRPAGLVKIKSGMDKEGNLKLWDFQTFFNYSRGSEVIYSVSDCKITAWNKTTSNTPVQHLPVGSWRAPGCNTHSHARESQIGIMAAKAGIDPLEFRLKNLKDEKMIGVLKAAAAKFGYIPAKSPSGKGIGIACGIDVGTWVALIAEVKVDKTTGHVQVIRVVCAQDMGQCINPLGTTLQIESCITMGMGYALTEEIKFKGGAIETLNFDNYEIPKFSWIPKIEAVIIDRKDQAPTGCGEPPIIGMGAVIANAVFDATGARLYQLPITPERMLKALNEL
jgi:isoquinoline 1-oxidoreductase